MSLVGASEAEKAQQRQQANQDHGANLQSQFNDDGSMKREYIRELTSTELNVGTVKMLSNMMTKDFVLGNYSEAESNEHRWLTRVIKLQVETLHPHHDSMWSGRFRQVAAGRGDQNLDPLSERELAIIRQFIRGVLSRASRSREGWQQEKMNESIAVSERRDPGDDDGGWLS